MLKIPTTTQEKRYVSLDKLSRLSCVRSPKGTGKTELITHIVNNELGSDEKALILVHRVALSLNTRGRVGGTHYEESSEAVNNSQVLHLCVNSLVHLEPRAWNNIGVVVIDELEQVLKHIAGDTCKRTRNQIRAKLQYVLTKAKRVLILDADLTDRGVETIQAVAGIPNEETETVLNTFEVKGKQYFELPDMTTVVGLAQQHLDNGERVVILCNTRKGAEAVFKDLGSEGLLVTKDTSGNPEQKDFLTSPNTYVEKYNLIVGSPSITTGLSIDKPIDAVFLVANRFDGLDDNDLRQALGRVRNPKRGYFFIEQPKHGTVAPDIESVVEAATRQAIKRNVPHTIDPETGIERLELSPTDLAWFKNDCAQEYEKTLSVRDLRNNFVRGLEAEGCTVIFDYFGPCPTREAVRALEDLREYRKTKEIESVFNDPYSPLCERIQGFYGTSELTREQVERYLNKDLEAKREQFYLTFAAPLYHLETEDKLEKAHEADGFKPRRLVETRNLRLEVLKVVSGGHVEALLTGNQVLTEQVLKATGLEVWLNRNKTKVTEVLGLKPERQLCRFVGRVLDQIGLGFEGKQCGARHGTTLKGVDLKRGEYFYLVSNYQQTVHSIKSGLWEYVPYGHQPKEYLEDDEVYENLF